MFGIKPQSQIKVNLKVLKYLFVSAVTQFRSSETHKNALKGDRAIKEMQFNADENQKNMEKLSELVEKLQGKIRT